jgi:hypothetical protein
MITALLLVLLTTTSSFAEERNLLDCIEVQGSEKAKLSIDGTIPYLEFSYLSKFRRVKMESTSGTEMMGQKEDWIVFFEFFGKDKPYRLSLYNFKTYETDLARFYTCAIL